MLKTLFLAFTLMFPFYYADVIVTAYTATVEECGSSDWITASGVPAIEGTTVACDFLPFGTVVEIDGSEYIVQDRFGGNCPNKIDVYMDSTSEAIKFGKQIKLVKVYY